MEAREERVEQLIAKLENDARNQLHSIRGTLELIAREPLTPSQSEFLRNCISSADRLLRSIQNVSEFLSPDGGKLRIVPFNLHELVAGLADVMSALARQKGLSLWTQIKPPVPVWVAGDPDQLQDILIRLLDNAIRFTDSGEVRLLVTEAQLASTEHRLEFEISDTGPGISADIVNRLARPLYGQTVQQGLGLPIVYKLVHRMNGALTINNKEVEGTRIKVLLAFRDVPAYAKNDDDSDKGEVSSLNILVAEDYDDSFYLLEGYLQQHKLTRAVNGIQAIDLFRSGRFDLVFMDIHMPEMDGYAATRAIRTWETGCARARVPIVVLSSDSPATQIQKGAIAGCSGFLTKPVSHEAVLSTVRRYAQRSAFQDLKDPGIGS